MRQTWTVERTYISTARDTSGTTYQHGLTDETLQTLLMAATRVWLSPTACVSCARETARGTLTLVFYAESGRA